MKKKHVTIEVILPLPPKPKRLGRPKKILDFQKLAEITSPQMESRAHALESLLMFDARCLDLETRRELLRVLPQLLHIQRAWKAEFMEWGCTSCHKKTSGHGAGGLCGRCFARIYRRMRDRYRKTIEGKDLPAELAKFRETLQLKYNTAQRLFNGGDE